ncbi:hypothetical protein VNI00_012875 [Paramarasmius palmivorus]|uniref:Apple domain-containing protein n=1 Tax=Paramarasmius palmivorus TaxID=297713 RepID=A0AAW0C0B4_9AGAR
MRFTAIFAAAAIFATGASAAETTSATTTATLTAQLGLTLTPANKYGAPIPPWKPGCKPGWYYGDHKDLLKIIIPWLKDSCLKCPKPPHHPPPNDGWTVTFENYDGATQADDYLTFGLVDTVDDCKAMCLGVDGCNFFNTYHDVNGKDGSPLLTCSLFAKCHDDSDATNKGGQTQPDGSVNYIADSAGYCKA